MPLDTLDAFGTARAANAQRKAIERLANVVLPPGVQAETTEQAVILTGKALRRRIIADPNLRNFGR